MHTNGWPTPFDTPSGSYFYHGENNEAYVGYVIPLDYKNPHLSPFDEFQKWKTHPSIKKYLDGAERLSYGARALIKGGLQSLPKLDFPGGLLIGDNAGMLNFSKIKGSHTAMKSGIIAGEHVYENLNDVSSEISFSDKVNDSWIYEELYKSRNFGPFFHKFGALIGAAFNAIDQLIFRGKLPFTLNHPTQIMPVSKKRMKCPKLNIKNLMVFILSINFRQYISQILIMKKTNPVIFNSKIQVYLLTLIFQCTMNQLKDIVLLEFTKLLKKIMKRNLLLMLKTVFIVRRVI